MLLNDTIKLLLMQGKTDEAPIMFYCYKKALHTKGKKTKNTLTTR